MKKGFTIIEVLIYMAMVSGIASALTIFVISNLKAYEKSLARQHVLNNVNDVLRLIEEEVKYAKSLYTPTSVLNSDSGQLSLETLLNVPAQESSTYVDFYADNGRVYEKREGQAALPLTSERVFIERLRFVRYATSSRDAIQTTIEARINTQSTQPEEQARVTVQSSAVLRGAY